MTTECDSYLFVIPNLFRDLGFGFGIWVLMESLIKSDIDGLMRAKESTIILVRKASQGISGGKGRLGIFPASFNPPTKAHLALVREARLRERLDEILVLLDVRAMDKTCAASEITDRLAMVEKAFERDLRVSTGLSSHGLFLDKIASLRRIYPVPVDFFFVVGFDTIVRVLNRKYYRNPKKSLDALFSKSHFLVANRGDREQRDFETLFRRRENKSYAGKVSYFTLSPQFSPLSSTLVRERIAEGMPVDRFVPAAVLQFIRKKGLYAACRS